MSIVAEAPTQEFAYRREIPEAWPGLLEHAQALVDQFDDVASPYRHPEALAAMHKAIEPLDNEALEANRYYGLGVAMCNFARRLSDPDTYAYVIESAADNIKFQAGQDDDPFKPGMQVSRIGQYGKDFNPWEDIATNSVVDMSAAQRLLAESLYAAFVIRDPSKIYTADAVMQAQSNGHSFVAESLVKNIDAGVSLVLRRALMVRAPEGAQHVTVNECIDPEQLDDLQRKLRKPSVSLARTRIDEVRKLESEQYHPIQDAEGTDPDGDWTFDRNYLATLPAANPDVLHQARQECPAIQVPGLMQLAGKCVAGIVKVADKKFADEYRECNGIPPERYVDPLDYNYLD